MTISSAPRTLSLASLALLMASAAMAQTITVTTTPAGQGTSVSPILFEASAGSTATLARQVTLGVTGASGSSFRQDSGLPGWLTVSGLPSAIGTSAIINFTANPTGLASGTYDATLRVRYDFGTNQSTFNDISVRLVIGGQSPSTLIANPSSLSFFGVPLTNVNTSQTVQVTNSGSPITYTVTTATNNGLSWLSTNVTGLTLTSGGSIQVTANAANLPANATAYTGTVTLTPTGGGQATNIPVSFLVSNNTQFQASPTSALFNYTTGTTPTTLNQQVSLSISTGAAIGFNATVNYLTGSQNWLSVSPVSGNASTTAQLLTLTANVNALPVGTSTAEVRITGSAANSPLVIPVTLVVSAPGALTATPNSLEFAAQPGSSAGPRTINVGVTAGGAQQFTPSAVYTSPASPTVQWLQVSSTSATTPAQVNVSIITASGSNTLAAGTYDGIVRLTPVTGSAVDVPVRLTVTSSQVMSVNVSSLSFTSTVGSPAVQQAIQITLSPATPNQQYSINFEPASGSPTGMITATPNFGTLAGNTSVSIGTNPTGLTAGTYSGVLRVFGVGSVFPSSIGIPVTYTVTNTGGGTTTNDVTLPSQLQFFAVGGSANQLEQQFLLTGTNANPVNFTLTPSVFNGAGWLTVSPTSGTTPATISVRVNPSVLSSGTSYLGQVLLTNTGTARDNTALSVTVNASANAQVQASPSALTFTYQAGSLNIPQFQTVSLTSSTGSSLPFTASISSGSTWFTVTPTAGSTTSSLAVSVNASALLALTAGTYDSTLQVVTPGAQNSTLTIPIRLVVTGTSSGGGGGTTQTLTIAPSSQIQFYSLQGGSQQQQIVSISANTGTPVFTVSANTGIGTGWLTATAINNNQVVVTATPGSLAPGQYTGSVTISSSGLAGGSQIIPVTLTVTGSTALVPSPQGLVFTYSGSGSNPAQQLLTLTTNTGAGLSYTASATTTSGGGWLLLSQSGGFAPGSLAVSVNALNLPAGTYTGTIAISTTGTVNPVQNIEVKLVVAGTTSTNSFIFSPSSLRFVAAPNGQQPPNQTVQVTTAGPVTNFIVSTNVQSPAGISWLQAAATSSVTPGTISVGVNPAGISTPGTYTGTVTVTGGGLSSTFTVELVISNNPQVQVSTRQINFNHQINGTVPAPRAIVVTSSILNSSLSFAAQATTTSGGNWLQVQQTTVSTPSAFLVSLAPSIVNSLPAGIYNGQITVSATGADNSPLQIPVTLNISASAQIVLSNNSPIVFNAGFNTASPPSQTLTVNATGTQPITVQATAQTQQGGSWLTASLNQNVTPATLTIGAISSGLSTGTYAGTVTITSGAGTALIPVTLVVSSQTLLNVSPRELNFGGSANQSQTISITSTGATAGYTVQGIVSSPLGGNWLQVNPVQANGATPGQVQVNAVPSSLSDGTYFGYVSVSSPGLPAVVIPVTLTINNATALTVNPNSLTFTMLQGQTPPSAQTLSVSSLVSTAFSVSHSSTAGSFLDITPTTGLTNAVLQIRPNSLASNLGVGTYTSTVTLSGTGSPNVVQFNVTLNVTPAITLAASPQQLNFTGRERSTQNPAAQTLNISASGGAIQGISVGVTTASGGNWLSVSPSTTQTPGTVSVQVNIANLAAGSYSGTVTVALAGAATTPVLQVPVSLTVERAAVPVITQVVNGASFQPGALAPGLIATIFGSNLGPADQGLGIQLVSGRVSRTLGGIRVLFDGVESPLLFVRGDQINCVVPYALTGRAQATIQVENNGVLSNQIIQRINDTAPGIFNLGSGQAAMLNQNNSINGIANPADRGTIGVLYMTGEGALTPPGVDGEVTQTIKRPIAPVSMRIGGVEVTNIQFVGAAPGLVQGVLQINFVIPENAPTGGNVPLTVTIGGANSQAGMTIAVR